MGLNAERRDKRTDQLISPRSGSNTVELNACTAFGTASPKDCEAVAYLLEIVGLKQCYPAESPRRCATIRSRWVSEQWWQSALR